MTYDIKKEWYKISIGGSMYVNDVFSDLREARIARIETMKKPEWRGKSVFSDFRIIKYTSERVA